MHNFIRNINAKNYNASEVSEEEKNVESLGDANVLTHTAEEEEIYWLNRG